MNYARHQQYRRLLRAGGTAIGSTAAMLVALGVASAGATSLAVVLLVVAAGFGFSARRWLGLAKRSRIGVRSEDEVRHQLAALKHEGWRMRHSLPWRGRGDIDSVAIAPSGLAFAIETKTKTYDAHHMMVVQQEAGWLWRRRRRWCRLGAMPVLCVVRAAGIQRWERGVLVVSLEARIPTLRRIAAEVLHPPCLASTASSVAVRGLALCRQSDRGARRLPSSEAIVGRGSPARIGASSEELLSDAVGNNSEGVRICLPRR